MDVVVFSLLNGILYGMLLFLIASGLTLIFSMMGVLNFAHASFYMLGAYLGFQISRWTGFWAALLLAPLVVGGIGAAVERFGLRHVRRQGHLAELLFTFGVALLVEEAVQMIWGRSPQAYAIPAELDFTAFTLFGVGYPAYRVFMLAVALAIFAALILALTRTRAGLIVKASLTHPDMVAMLGHDVPLVFVLVFGAGCALAGIAGVIAGPVLVTQPSMAGTLGPILFVIVVVGGLGSLAGAFVASLLIGLIQSFAVASDLSAGEVFASFGLTDPPKLLADVWSVTVAQLGSVLPYLLLVLVLVVRPTGLIGKRA